MKTFLIVAQSLDGFIARNPDQSSLVWTSKADTKRFVSLTKRAGVIVMGAKTFSTIGKTLPGRRMIVYSSKKIVGVETTTLPPRELIKKLEAEGHSEVAICGGSQIYTLFAKAGVIDTMYVTIESFVFGSGVRLFTEHIPLDIELVNEETKTEGSTIFLTYRITHNGHHH